MEQYQAHTHHRNYGCRLSEFQLKGYRALSLENEKIRVTVLVDKGTDIYEFLYKPKDVDFLWRSYTGLRAMKNYQPMAPPADGMFSDFYEGGWQEMFPWGGHPSLHRGVNTGLHGEVTLTPWDYRIDTDTPEEVCVTCSVRTRRAPFLVEKTLAIYRHKPALHIQESIQNESGTDLQVVWGYHPAYGWPFLDETCAVELPPCQVLVGGYLDETSRLKENQEAAWPKLKLRAGGEVDISRIAAPSARSHDLAAITGFQEGWYAIRSQSKGVGCGLSWDAKVFPWLWFWQLYRGCPDYPFWGSEYVVAIEPVTSRALSFSDAVENGTVRTVAAGETLHNEVWAWAFEGSGPVQRVSSQGVELRRG
ncbi:MAG TPA: DUF4432 family protein [Terriglobia bacterium]|nr:DUF4432 family protein [Terriglobia bacterium]